MIRIGAELREEEVEVAAGMNDLADALGHGNQTEEDHPEIATDVVKSPSPENLTLLLSKRKLISFFQLRLLD